MAISGTFVLFLLVGIVAFLLAMALKNWIVKLLLFIVLLGAINTTMTISALAPGWALLINAVVFLAVGIRSIRIPSLGNRILGIVLTVLGVVLVLFAVDALGTNTTGTIWGAIVQSFQHGWTILMDTFRKVFGIS